MKKSKHFRKDVIMARLIAAGLLVVLIMLIVFVVSFIFKPSNPEADSQNTQNTESVSPGGQDTEDIEPEGTQGQDITIQDTESETGVNTESESEAKIYVMTTTQVKLRAQPNTNCATLDRIDGGTKLEVLEQLHGWFKVTYNGKEGYVSATYAKIVEE